MMMPPWPGWDGLHPLIVHFPIALLLVAPLFVVLAALRAGRSTAFGVSALVLLALGTASAFVAVETGEAAAELAPRTEAIAAAIQNHSGLAEAARNIFAGLTVLYAVLLVLPAVVKKLGTRRFALVANVIFLVLMLGGDLVLVNAAHRGGLLVHKFGVQAMLPPGS